MATKKKSTGNKPRSTAARKRTTSKDVPGSGMAKRAARAIEKRRKMLDSI